MSSLVEARPAAAPIEAFDTAELPVRFACEVKGFDPKDYFDHKEDAFRAVFDEWLATARVQVREQRLQAGIGLEERIYNAYHAYFELVVVDPEMFEFLRRNADAIAMLGSDDLFTPAVREFIEDMQQWISEGQLTAEVEPWLPFIARSIAGGAFQIAALMADQGHSDVDATAGFCARLMLDGLRGFR